MSTWAGWVPGRYPAVLWAGSKVSGSTVPAMKLSSCSRRVLHVVDAVGVVAKVSGPRRGPVVEPEHAVAGVGEEGGQGLPAEVLVGERAVDEHHGVGMARRRTAGPVDNPRRHTTVVGAELRGNAPELPRSLLGYGHTRWRRRGSRRRHPSSAPDDHPGDGKKGCNESRHPTRSTSHDPSEAASAGRHPFEVIRRSSPCFLVATPDEQLELQVSLDSARSLW